MPSELDIGAKEFLKKILHKDPAQRMTITEIKQHRWITEDGKLKMEDNVGKISVSEIDKLMAIYSFASSKGLAKIKRVMMKMLIKVRSRLAKK